MPHVTSADGTRIAYDREGTGPAVILVGGTLERRCLLLALSGRSIHTPEAKAWGC